MTDSSNDSIYPPDEKIQSDATYSPSDQLSDQVQPNESSSLLGVQPNQSDNQLQDYIEKIKNSDDFFNKARLIDFLQKQRHISTKELSNYLGIKPSYLCHIARLNRLPEIVIDAYYSKSISVSHLFIIARLKDHPQMIEAYEKVLSQNLSVLQTEELIREYLYSIKTEGLHISKEDVEIAKEQIKLHHKDVAVKIVQTRVKAKVVIELKGNLKQTTQALKEILGALSK